jgi:hypothetical protein
MSLIVTNRLFLHPFFHKLTRSIWAEALPSNAYGLRSQVFPILGASQLSLDDFLIDPAPKQHGRIDFIDKLGLLNQ